jgi:DNA replication protein DnaC
VDSVGDPECPHCGGSGWVRVPDGGGGAARSCACRDVRRIPRLLEAAGIPPRYRGCTIAGFHTPKYRQVAAKQICQRYVQDFLKLDGSIDETGLLLMGVPGTGKTHLAAAVLSDLIRQYGVRGRFVDFTSLVHRIQSTFDPSSPESKHDVLDPVVDAQVLVLDELGALKPTPFVDDTLYLILNTRYTRRAPTLVTTNYRLRIEDCKSEADLLETRIPPRLVSRLYEMAKPVLLDADDFRARKLEETTRI